MQVPMAALSASSSAEGGVGSPEPVQPGTSDARSSTERTSASSAAAFDVVEVDFGATEPAATLVDVVVAAPCEPEPEPPHAPASNDAAMRADRPIRRTITIPSRPV